MPTVVELESLLTKFLGDNSDLLKKLDECESAFKRTARVGNESLGSISSSFKSLGDSAINTALKLVELDGGLLGVSQRAVKLAAEAESLKVAFTVMTGSAQTAEKTIKDLYQFAASTPFKVGEVVESSRKLLAAGVQAGDLVPIMRSLGDVAAGVDKPLNEIVYTFGSIKSQGTAMTMDMREFANRGIPIWLAVAKVMKLVSKESKSVSEEQMMKLHKMVEEGRISFAVVQEAFKEMSGKGGMFEGMTEKQSQTLKGMFSNLQDDMDNVLRNFGKDIAEQLQLKEVMKEVSALAKSFDGLNEEQKKVLITTGAIAIGVGVTVTGFFSLSAAVAIASAAMTAFNLRLIAIRGSLYLLNTAIVVGLAYGIRELTNYLADIKTFNEELERSSQILSKRSDASDARFKGIAESAKGITDYSKREALLNEKIAETEAKKTIATEAYNKAKAEQEELIKKHSIKSNLIFTDRVLVQPDKIADLNEAFDRTKMARDAVGDLTEGINILNKAREREVHAGGLVLGNAKLTVEELNKLELAYLKLGLTEDKAHLAELKKKGLSDFELTRVEDAMLAKRRREVEVAGITEEIKKREELVQKIKDTAFSLREEYETRLDITEVQKLQHAINKLEVAKSAIPTKFGPDFESNLLKISEINAALTKARGALDFAQKLDDFKAVKKILDDIKTPLEKFNEEKKKLTDLFQRDQLSWEQYSTAMDKAEKEFKDATKAANDFKDALSGIDAAISKSAEAVARTNAYKEMLKNLPTTNVRDWAAPAPMPREKGRLAPPPIKPSTQQMMDDPFFYLNERKKKVEQDRLNGVPMQPNAMALPPNEAETETVKILTTVAGYILQLVQKEGVVIAPANLNN